MRVILILLAVVGCRASSQLGEDCAMVKRDPNVDGGRLYVTNGELKAGASKDFISFGSTDCDDLICVRDSFYAPADGGGLNPNETARGYCSRSCIAGTPCVSSAGRMQCRPLLLDEETLRALCNGSEADRAKCKAYLGSSSSPDFCARGGIDP